MNAAAPLEGDKTLLILDDDAPLPHAPGAGAGGARL